MGSRLENAPRPPQGSGKPSARPARDVQRRPPMNADVARKTVFDTLSLVAPGTLLFVDYVAAGKPSPEAEQLRQAGLNPHHYIGRMVKVEKKGNDPVFTMIVLNRQGQPRCFNPFKGTLNGIRPCTDAEREVYERLFPVARAA